MPDRDLVIRFDVDAPPETVVATITDVGGWWSGRLGGAADALGDEFVYEQPGMHRSVQRVTALEPARLVEWTVTEARLSFVADPGEWTGTRIRFELEPIDGGTRVVFRHVGLTPAEECYEACSGAWHHFIAGELRRAIVARAAGAP